MRSDRSDSVDAAQVGTTDPIRVAVIGGVRLYREGLIAALQHAQSLEVVVESREGVVAVGDTAPAPDVVLVDAPLGPAADDSAARARLIAVGNASTPETQESIATWVPADVSLDELVNVVLRVARPGRQHDDGEQRSLRGHIGAPRAIPPLTERETEILGLIDQALTNREIAQRLSIELTTVKNHVHNLLQKLEARRRAQAAAWLRAQLSAPKATSGRTKDRSKDPLASPPAVERLPAGALHADP